ncbi:hypothetical protein OSB04_002940 [Centaurea solstitialis]|uniref:Histone-lysine N-methyltransferase ASHH2 n=1 Tax=Centaurea solstitialis TaxID=347529 RepID=A0AA38WV18_9ASTR|nr:hypothetical protein OSB04_002940 [Centaurea solstitialis]
MANKDSEILLPEDTQDASSDFNELVSNLESNCLADTLSDFLESCEPFSVTDPEPSNNLDEPNISRTDVLVDPFNSIVITEPSDLRDNDGKDSSRIHHACGEKNNEIKRSSTRRSTRKSTLTQKTDTKLAARKGSRTSGKRPMLDLLAADVGRRRRSDLAQRARPSAWGLGGKIDEIFKQYIEKNVDGNGHIESRKGRMGRRGGKRDTEFVNQSIQNLQGESRALNKGLLLKLKLGTKVIQNCQFNTVPDMDKDLESYREVKIDASALQHDIKDNNEKEVSHASMSRDSDGNLDKRVAGKAGSEFHDMIGIGGESVENRCLDPGTSPDSEVINVIPETQISGIIAEGLNDVHISSKDCIAHQSGDCGDGSGIPSPEIVSDVLLCDKFEHGEKQIEGSWSSGHSISIATGVASSNASSREGCPVEPMVSLQETEVGVSMDILTIEGGLKADFSIAGIESVESSFSDKLLSGAKTNGQNLQKSSKSRGTTKSMPRVPDSLNKKRTNCRQKGSQAKPATKGKILEKSGNDQADCDVEGDPATGSHEINDVRVLEEGCTTGALSNSTMVPSEGESRQGSPRSAWVCCDDCHKWRRISAVLADSIESTECRWICKDNMDKTFGDCSIPQEKSNADINEELELSDASCEEDACNPRLNTSQLGQKQPIDPPQSSWKLIKTNMFLHRNRKNQTIDESNMENPSRILGFGLILKKLLGMRMNFFWGWIMVCHCKPLFDGRMGCRDECLNRMLNIECVKGTCPCGEFCSNQQWMVNGEVCIGLFAIRDIKKGEELTFDYNYVRVFGAAAKKCVCGSSRCRGVIGGDSQNGETVILGDSDEEDLEPVTFYNNSSNKLGLSRTSIYNGAGTQTAESASKNNDSVIDKFVGAADHLEDVENKQSPDSLLVVDDKNDDPATPTESTEREVSCERSSPAALALESQIEHVEGLLPFSAEPLDTLFKIKDGKRETRFLDAHNNHVAEKDMKGCLSVGGRAKTSLDNSGNLLPDDGDSKKKPKSHTNENKCTILKPKARSKLPSSAVKRGKSKSHGVNKPPEIDSKPLVVPQRTKALVEDNLTGRFEAVQEALNTLLNTDGGISKRRDASKGYLKLLCLTAHSGNGEGIQSNRDLSMIMDALLKTKSRTVLLDIISKNGLQMLHNLLKRFRKEFTKIPILRKLLKVLEYLAETKILTLENILKPSPNGAESFKESILSLTEHADKQVHQIARNFRDRWIPWSARKVNWADRDVDRMENQSSPSFKTVPVQHDRDRRPSEVADNCIQQSVSGVDARTSVEGSAASCLSSCTDGTRTRKRKSRWDQPGDIESPSNRPKTGGSRQVNHTVQEERQINNDEDGDGDAPPGFSSPINRQLFPSSAPSTSTDTHRCKSVIGYPQERYVSRLPTSFGIPCSAVQQLGTPEGESWSVGPATTFHPFPPLPPYPRREEQTDMQFNQPNFQRFRNSNSNNTLGRRYFKQQKWNNSRSGLPWNHHNKYGSAGFNQGYNRRNDAAGMMNGSCGNNFYQQPQQ